MRVNDASRAGAGRGIAAGTNRAWTAPPNAYSDVDSRRPDDRPRRAVWDVDAGREGFDPADLVIADPDFASELIATEGWSGPARFEDESRAMWALTRDQPTARPRRSPACRRRFLVSWRSTTWTSR